MLPLILTLQPQMVLEGYTPLLLFVNVKSGGCQGIELVSSFRKLLNPHQIFNLDAGGPLPGCVLCSAAQLCSFPFLLLLLSSFSFSFGFSFLVRHIGASGLRADALCYTCCVYE